MDGTPYADWGQPTPKGMTKIPVAVITNGALLWWEGVRDALNGADLVLPSLDAADGAMFRYVNRPHEDIAFAKMISGIDNFSEHFQGAYGWRSFFLPV